MDLDSVKKTWQQTDLKPGISEEKILRMLDNKGQSALARLLWFEKLGLWLLIPCSLILILMWHIHLIVFVMFTLFLLTGAFWQLYKVKFLSKIDTAKMNILEISANIYTYRRYIYKELIIAIFLMILFFAFYTFFIFNPQLDLTVDTIVNGWLVKFILVIAFAIIITCLVYKALYVNNIRKIEDAIKEVEEFEKDNNE